jgi:hypothetical protein
MAISDIMCEQAINRLKIAINLLAFGLGILVGLVIALFMLPRGCL